MYFCDGAVKGKILKILEKHYELVFTNTNPDYIFYSVMGCEHIYYDMGIRIFSCGENVRADFNFCDYAIGFDYMHFEDRYMRYPLYLHNEIDMQRAQNKHILSKNVLDGKKRFCTFVVSNGKADECRNIFFELLSTYKRVDSGGRYKNNVGAPVEDKHSFIKSGRFHIAFENSSTNGYTTEKLIQALAAQTVPIYWGDDKVGLPLNAAGGGA